MRNKLYISILAFALSSTCCFADDFSDSQVYPSSSGLRSRPRYDNRQYEDDSYARRQRMENNQESDHISQQRALYRRRMELENQRLESDVEASRRGNNISTVNQMTGAVNNIARVGNYINQIFSGN